MLFSSFALLLAASVLLGLLLLYFRQLRSLSRNAFVIPGGLPILGHALTLGKRLPTFLDWIWEMTLMAKEKPFQVKVLGQPAWVFLTNPQSVKYILADNFENYEKGINWYDRMEEFLGDGIFNVDGAVWHSQRKIASHIFTRNDLEGFISEVVTLHGAALMSSFDELAKSGKELDLQDWLLRFTMETIGTFAFGTHFGNLDVHGFENNFARNFDIVQRITQERFLTPSWSFRKTFWFLFQSERDFKSAMKFINSKMTEVIEQRRRELGTTKHRDLLSLFMTSTDDEGKHYTDKSLRDMVISFTLAGRDTTASAMTWLIWNLCQHQHVHDKLNQELDEVLQGKSPNYDDLQHKLPYLEACVKESLRLYPSVPKDGKYCINDDTLPDGTHIPSGCLVWFCPWVMGRMESLWEDALTFNPDRFLDGHEPSQFKYTAFNAGPRLCLGKRLAEIEMKMVVVMILQRFNIICSPGQDDSYLTSIILQKRNGLKIRLQRRS